MATKTIPESTKSSLGQRLRARQRERWPGLAGVQLRSEAVSRTSTAS